MPSADVTFIKPPDAPSPVTLTNVTTNSVHVTFTDGANNGSAIDARHIGYGTTSNTPQKTISSNKSTTITGLIPGVKYYFWVRAHNAAGWSSWSASRNVTMISIVRINVSGIWKTAIPYVNVGGVWKNARPWTRNVGIWKEST